MQKQRGEGLDYGMGTPTVPEAIKNCTEDRPGNEATQTMH